jgi:hypothetical protein
MWKLYEGNVGRTSKKFLAEFWQTAPALVFRASRCIKAKPGTQSKNGQKDYSQQREGRMGDQRTNEGIKVLYCGPAHAGKRTNLEYLAANCPGNRQTHLETIEFGPCSLLVFKVLPTHDLIKKHFFERTGASGPITVYSLVGAVENCVEIIELIEGMHSVVFVADALRARHPMNVTSMRILNDAQNHLKNRLVLQYNKYDPDHPHECTAHERLERELNWCGAVSFEAQALKGLGVFATLSAAVMRAVAASPNQQWG